MSDYEIIDTADSAEELYAQLRSERAVHPWREFDLVEVRTMTRPVRTAAKFALVRKKKPDRRVVS